MTGIPKEFEGTRVDLGDDLLESPAVDPLKRLDSPTEPSLGAQPNLAVGSSRSFTQLPNHPGEFDDALESARILVNEGMPEEAKKVLHRILMIDPANVLAREKLTEIHDIELRQLFGDSEMDESRLAHESDPDTVIRELDRDLELDLDGITEYSLFEDEKALENFALRIEEDLISVSPRERIDLGIAFYEMGLIKLAVRQFGIAARDPGYLAEATLLEARARISEHSYFEATLCLEPLLSDSDLPPPTKLESMYWMARACEGLRRKESAVDWYERIRDADPEYRDVIDRLRRLKC